MSGMKSKLGLFMAAAMMSMGNYDHESGSQYRPLTEEEKKKLKELSHKKKVDRLKNQGVNEYVFNGHSVFARTEKKAIEKAIKKGYISNQE